MIKNSVRYRKMLWQKEQQNQLFAQLGISKRKVRLMKKSDKMLWDLMTNCPIVTMEIGGVKKTGYLFLDKTEDGSPISSFMEYQKLI